MVIITLKSQQVEHMSLRTATTPSMAFNSSLKQSKTFTQSATIRVVTLSSRVAGHSENCTGHLEQQGSVELNLEEQHHRRSDLASPFAHNRRILKTSV